METALYILHVLVCIAMLPIILLQSGKGGGVSAVFGGGGSGTVFGSRGASNFLTRMTTGAAIIFMCTSMGLSWMSSQSRSVVAGEPGDVAPATGLGTEPIEPEGEVAPGTSGEPIDNASADPGNAPLEIELAPPSEEAAAE